MPSGKEYLDFVMDQLSALEDVGYRAMMGEYVLYCRGRIVGGVYDDRLLIKPTDSARRLMPHARPELPYEGAKEMLLAENIDDREFLCALVDAVAGDLPAPKRKR
jgi:TfoX/Sxy family transcriptional regulator of competence genes